MLSNKQYYVTVQPKRFHFFFRASHWYAYLVFVVFQVSIYMPSMKVVKNVTERMKNLGNFLVSVCISYWLVSIYNYS